MANRVEPRKRSLETLSDDDLNTLFSFCVTRGNCDQNPVEKTSVAKELSNLWKFLTVDQTVRLLNTSTPDAIPYLAIGTFAGLRSTEILRLDWAEIDLQTGLIEVTAKKSKLPVEDS